MLQWVREQLSKTSLESSALKKIELASEEALVNIIQHAYNNRSGEIELQVKIHRHQIEIIIRDQGPPFDPLQVDTRIDTTLPLEKREAGGLGIHFIRQCMDEVHYQRVKRCNILTLIKKISCY